MNRRWPRPSWKTTFDARMCRMLDEYQEGYYEIVSITMNTLIIVYAGYEIRFWVENDRVKNRPKKIKLKHLEEEDLAWLNRLALQWLHASHEGIRILTERRKEEAEFKRKCKACDEMNRKAMDPQEVLPLDESKCKPLT